MIELTTSLLVLLSMLYGGVAVDAEAVKYKSPQPNIAITDDRNIVDGIALFAPANDSKTLEGDVREYFNDTPILAEIARCESSFRHIGGNGEIIRGEINSDDMGVMQINNYYHEKEAKRLGLNLKTLNGNMAYAKWLYEKEGTTPWKSSSGCWEKYKTISKK